MDLKEELLKICEIFNKKDVKYILAGGLALLIHGIPRYTEDIDFIIYPSSREIEKIKTALFEVFQDQSILELEEKDIEYAVVRYGTPKGYFIDLIFKIGEVADYYILTNFIEEKEIKGIKIRLLSKKGLIILKKGSPREIDRLDVRLLESIED